MATPAEDAARLAWAAKFRAWMDGNGITSTAVRKLCRVGAATVSKWRAGEAMPSEQHLHTLERAGLEP